MKITLYVRKDGKRAGYCTMSARVEEEPCYDTPRTLNLGYDIHKSIMAIIAKCKADGVFAYGRDNEYKTVKTRPETAGIGAKDGQAQNRRHARD